MEFVPSQPVIIANSKKKITFLLLGAIGFVAIGLWFLIDTPHISNTYWGSPLKLKLVGYAAIVLFGMGSIYLFFKLFDKKPGLIIDNTILFDNSSALSVGEILWIDMEQLSVLEINRQKLIVVFVRNADEYINKQQNVFKRKMMQLNNKMYGSPIIISASALQVSFQELLQILMQQLDKSRLH